MGTPLRVLIIEDSEDDALLLRMQLERGGYELATERVETAAALAAALAGRDWDVILADFRLPGFDGLAALKLVREHRRDVPFILVSGAVGEELAVAAMKAGANDFLVKDRLARLVPAVRRELSEAEGRRQFRLAQEALRESERNYRIVADNAYSWEFWLSPDGRFVYNSPSCRRVTGYDAEAFVADAGLLDRMIHPEDRAGYHGQLAVGGETCPIGEVEFRVIHRDGSVRWLSHACQPVYDVDGRFLGRRGSNRDITDRKQMEAELRRATDQAERANRAKSQFLASMSHELRTPLGAILGMTELALVEPVSDEVRDYLQTVKDSAESLLDIVNEILDLSRIESGRLALEATPFRLRALVEQMIKALAVRAAEKGLELRAEIAPEVADHLIGDPLRLRQVLINLVGNALKFTRRGHVVVAVGLADDAAGDSPDDGGIRLAASVSDTGIGIAAEDLERIFAPFTQADASTTRRFGGTGLGLTIARGLIELMGGHIRVDSQPGRGSTFSFNVPLRLSPGRAGGSDDARGDRTDLRGWPVLLVTDDPDARLVLRRSLADWGIEPDAVADAPAAEVEIRRAADAGRSYRLVLIEAAAPGIDGLTLARRLRDAPDLAAPVILLTTEGRRTREVCRDADLAAICLEKPISPTRLLQAVTGALDLRPDAQAAGPIRPARSRAPERPLRVLLADDTSANQKFVTHVLARRGHTVRIARDGREALDRVRDQEFDVVLMDVQMPRMDGLEATAAIRRLPDPRRARVPIIALTAHALTGDRERCLAAGMDAYVSKPIRSDELIEVVERLGARAAAEPALGRGREPGEPPRGAGRSGGEVGNPPPVAVGVYDHEEALANCLGDDAFFRVMVACCFDEAAPLMAQMRSAAASGDGEDLHHAAHRLGNTIAYLAARPTRSALMRVEEIGRSGDLSDAAEALTAVEHELARLLEALAPHRRGDGVTGCLLEHPSSPDLVLSSGDRARNSGCSRAPRPSDVIGRPGARSGGPLPSERPEMGV